MKLRLNFKLTPLYLFALIAASSCTGSGVVAGDSGNNSSPNMTSRGSSSNTSSANTSAGAASTNNADKATTEIKVNSGTAVKSATINK